MKNLFDILVRKSVGDLWNDHIARRAEEREAKEKEKILQRVRQKRLIYDLQRTNQLRNKCTHGEVDDQSANRTLGVTITRTTIAEVEFHYNLKQWVTQYWGRADFPIIAKRIVNGDIHLGGTPLDHKQKNEIDFLRWLFVNNVEKLTTTPLVTKEDWNDDIPLALVPTEEEIVIEGILDIDEQVRRTRAKLLK